MRYFEEFDSGKDQQRGVQLQRSKKACGEVFAGDCHLGGGDSRFWWAGSKNDEVGPGLTKPRCGVPWRQRGTNVRSQPTLRRASIWRSARRDWLVDTAEWRWGAPEVVKFYLSSFHGDRGRGFRVKAVWFTLPRSCRQNKARDSRRIDTNEPDANSWL